MRARTHGPGEKIFPRSPKMSPSNSPQKCLRRTMTYNDRTVQHCCLSQAGTSVWILGYQQDCLDARCGEATVDAYVRILRQFTVWVAKLPGQGGQFVPSQLTQTAVERYLSVLKEQGYSISHRTRVKTVINGFCQW